jgi:hypothetical protein
VFAVEAGCAEVTVRDERAVLVLSAGTHPRETASFSVSHHDFTVHETRAAFAAARCGNFRRKAMSEIDRRSALGIGLAAATTAMMKPAAAQTAGYKDTTPWPGVVVRE